MNKDVIRIKKTGRLLAFNDGWQYWLCGDVVYAVGTDGERFNVWCSTERLGMHLHKLFLITGKKYFTEGSDMMIVDNEFMTRFSYA